ncbi:hypothetical protein ACFL49_01020 [Candidatus Omnitrophota bacterium]
MSEITCPHCQNPIYDPDALLCHFCGESLNRSSKGVLGRMHSGQMKIVSFFIFILLLCSFLLWLVF